MNNANYRRHIAWLRLMIGVVFFASASVTRAAESNSTDGWNFGVEVYLWGAGIGGETITGDDIDISFSDLISNLDMGGMGTLVAQKNRWSLIADVIYLDVSDSIKTTGNIVGVPTKSSVKVNMESWIVHLLGGYRVAETDTSELDLVVGTRYLWIETALKLTLEQPIVAERRFKESGDGWDGVIGMRGQTKLSDRWYLNYYGDIGTGNADFTWQARAGFGYSFQNFDMVAGYRYVDWDFDDGDVFDDLDISGPYLGARFVF